MQHKRYRSSVVPIPAVTAILYLLLLATPNTRADGNDASDCISRGHAESWTVRVSKANNIRQLSAPVHSLFCDSEQNLSDIVRRPS